MSTPSLDPNTNSQNCHDKMIRLDRSITGEHAFRINKSGLFVFYIQVFTYGEDIVSSLMVNGVEVLQMSTKGKGYYASEFHPISNDASMYPVLHLQVNDEVSFRNISGSFTDGCFIGWSVAE